MTHKILIADDEDSIHSLLRRALPDAEYAITSAVDGDETLRQAREGSPDLILLDVHMPGKDGMQILAELRRDTRTRMVPVILVTGDAAPGDRVRGLDSGADDYVGKPFDVRELTARISSVLRRNRRDMAANPLTKLPGSPTIEEEVSRRISDREPFAFLYVDIDHFKAYNDAYGYARGDGMLQELSECLVGCAAIAGAPGDFVGHVGGDDFVVVCDPARAEQLARAVASRFDRAVPRFYGEIARRWGFIETRDRLGRWRHFPLASLSIGIVSTATHDLQRYAQVVERASEMKAWVKARGACGKSRYAFDRRVELRFA
ncbi:MAG: response regulator [Elusimicrobia bacterium]|nr:response regulator [Elusimicrobiota bacterium]